MIMRIKTHILGQALVESIIGLSFVIIPLLIILPLLSKTAEVQHRAQESSHYSVWERTVWREKNPDAFTSSGGGVVAKKTSHDIANTVPWRFFQNNGQKITSEYRDDWDWQQSSHPVLKYQMTRNAVTQELVIQSKQQSPQNEIETD